MGRPVVSQMARYLLVLKMTLLSFSFSCLGQSSVEEDRADLEEQIQICEQLTPYMEFIDGARLDFLRQTSEATLQQLKRDPISRELIDLYDFQIITYSLSRTFLESIKSGATEELIDRLVALAEKIARKGRPTSKLTNYIFTRIYQQFRDLEDRFSNASWTDKVNRLDLWVNFADVIASSSTGDHGTNCAAVRLHGKIKSLFADLHEIAVSSDLAYVVQSIIALTLIYEEYAKPDPAQCPAP